MTDVPKYNQTKNLRYTPIQHLIQEYEEELIQMSGKCMDIGSGTGDVARYIILPALDPRAIIIGTDIAEDMIKHAKELHNDEERLKFEVLDIQTKHLPEKYVSEYDHIFAFHVLHWCDDTRQPFENIYRLLRPGGTMLMVTIVQHDIFDILYKLSQDTRYTSYVTHLNNFLPPFYNSPQPGKEVKALLKSIGFNILHCSHRERTISDQQVQELPNLVLSLVTQYFKNMPRECIEEFKDDFIQEYTKRRFFHKQMCYQREKITSDLHEILVIYAQKDYM